MDGKPLIPGVEVTVEGFTSSFSFDVFQNGCKHSNFVSMNFRTSRPVTPEEAMVLEVEASATVTASAFYTALARGLLSVDEVKDLVDQSKERHEKLAKTLRKKMFKKAEV